jgi:hypothetical protein
MIDKLIKEMHKGSLTGYFSLFIEGVNDTGDKFLPGQGDKSCPRFSSIP